MLELKKPTVVINESFKKELKYLITKAKGYNRTTANFANVLKMINPKQLDDLLKGNYTELPDRNLLRKIALNSYQGNTNYKILYQLCGYSESDPEEDRSWAKWIPEWAGIYRANLGTPEDSIQGSERPILIISNDMNNKYASIVIGIPISTKHKGSDKINVHIGKEYNLKEDSYILCNQIRVMSKRAFFYNGNPWKIGTLDNSMMQKVRNVLEFQFNFESTSFDPGKAFLMIDSIKTLQQNISVKQSKDLLGILDEKFNEFMKYCDKYHKNYKNVMSEYERLCSNRVYA